MFAVFRAQLGHTNYRSTQFVVTASSAHNPKTMKVVSLDNYTFDKRMADARVIYEETHGLTSAELSQITGTAKRVLREYARTEGWAKKVKEGQTVEAAEAVKRFAKYLAHIRHQAEALSGADSKSEIAKLDDDQPNSELDIAADAVLAANRIREAVLERHRTEWSVPRSLSAEAIRVRDTEPVKSFERAKLAKITAETLKLVQEGERQALGLDVGDKPKGHVVVIDRD